ncbi:MAG: polyphosphate kinase 1 [Planctomycetota bacterium]
MGDKHTGSAKHTPPGGGRPGLRLHRAPAAPARGEAHGGPAAGGAIESARFFNRDVSWLEFNRRVMQQAADPRTPLLERVKFLAIFTTNLDEFFMKRVGVIKRAAQSSTAPVGPDGMTPRQQMASIRGLVCQLQQQQVGIFRSELIPALAEQDIHVLRYTDLSSKDRDWVNDWYRVHVFPALTPLAVDSGHRFPFISNLSDNLGLLVEPPPLLRGRPGATAGGAQASREPMFARVKVPPAMKRFVALPHEVKNGKRVVRFVYLHDVIRNNLADLFPGVKIREQSVFRVTRSAGIQRDEMEGESLIQSVEEDLKQRRFARAVRLEIEPDASPEMAHFLLDKLTLDAQDLYEQPPDEYDSLFELFDIDRPDLKEPRWRPVTPHRLIDPKANIFAAIRKQDILVHHPYESFADSVERFIAAAAVDPDVVTIKQTLYRTSPDSPFIQSMIRAAEAGKQVACLVELRARFDEDKNVRFARMLEKAGVHVAYGVMGLKTHCKTALVVRRERHGLRCYAHIGTGNYNPKTASLYTDFGILTCDPEITADAVTLFNYLTGVAVPQKYETLLVAPFNMRERIGELIDREIEHARAGKPARIIAKINSMEDRDVTERLYAASAAGVQIDLIVRGFCCLRPGVRGLSDNIRVVSVIGRFLEHSRVFHFGGGQEDPLDGEWYIGSADWMYRNLSNRVECAVPVRDSDARKRLLRLFEIMLADHRHAWDLDQMGTYTARHALEDAPASSPERMGTFATLMREV